MNYSTPTNPLLTAPVTNNCVSHHPFAIRVAPCAGGAPRADREPARDDPDDEEARPIDARDAPSSRARVAPDAFPRGHDETPPSRSTRRASTRPSTRTRARTRRDAPPIPRAVNGRSSRSRRRRVARGVRDDAARPFGSTIVERRFRVRAPRRTHGRFVRDTTDK